MSASNPPHPPPKPQMEASASVYTTLALRFYDLVVLTLSNALAWRCPTGSVLLPFYQRPLRDSSAHLEIGVGTGYYPAASVPALSKTQRVTLLDLNPATLAYARTRLLRAGFRGAIDAVEHNIFRPLSEPDIDTERARYDSVALFYVFHCLPGALPKKATDVFANVVPVLAPGGVVYGSTILGHGVRHNWLGRRLMGLYNRKGIFGNTADSEEGLREALAACFEEYEVRVVGVVALFEARKPKAVES